MVLVCQSRVSMNYSNVSCDVECCIAVAAVKFNETLKELFVADNKLTPSDGVQLGSLLKTNHTLALLDLRNNLLQVSCDKSAET